METTETQLDGTIEGAIAALIKPEEPEVDETEGLDDEAEDQPEAYEDEAEEPEQDEADESEDEEDEEEDPEEDAGSEELYVVKIDGKEAKVTLEDLKRGYSGQQYVQKGMQEAAQLRKEAENAYSALMAERQQVSQVLNQIHQGQFLTPPKAPDRSIFESDPIGYMEAKMKYDDDLAAFSGQQAQYQQFVQQQSYAEQQAQQAYLQQELEVLKTAVPEFADPKTAGKARDELLKVGTDVYGYAPEEIGMVMDHRAIRVLRDAAKYQAMMKGKTEAVKSKAVPRSRPVKGGAKKTDSNVKAARERKSKLKQSGSIEDALGLILNT